MRLIDADAFDEWLEKHEEAAALLEAADSDVFVDKDRKTYYSTQSFRDVMRYRPTIKENFKMITYSNTICPHCHSGEVVWHTVTTPTSATSKLKCLHCQHIFDPPTIQLPEKKTRYFPTITLCGSTRFRDMFLYLQKELTLEGYIVLSVGCFGHYETGEEAKRIEDSKKLLDEIHKRKIDMSDAIYVINPGGYIGDSTQSEIEYAKMNNKEIYYLIPPRKKYLN